jgi:hypothetical protein
VPHNGWRCIDIKDLGEREPRLVCEMCKVVTIRYVHEMQHDDYPEILYCGCVCAGHMEEDLVGAQAREKTFKASKKWLARRWRYTIERDSDGSLNNAECIKIDGFHVSVWQRRDSDGWAAKVEHRDTGRQRYSKLHYPTMEAAKLAAFDVMIGMKQKRKG